MGYISDNQNSTARIASAFAHELCNPLQGIRSLIEVLHREGGHGAGMTRKLERVEDGMNRLACVLDAFRATYENLPRPADQVLVDGLLDQIAQAVRRGGATISIEHDIPKQTMVFALAPELATLIGHALIDHAHPPVHIEVRALRTTSIVSIQCETTSSTPLAMPWIEATRRDGLTGLPVLVDEITHQSGGEASFRYDDFGLRAVRVDLPIQP
jgi:signal transduction histidine kinase